MPVQHWYFGGLTIAAHNKFPTGFWAAYASSCATAPIAIGWFGRQTLPEAARWIVVSNDDYVRLVGALKSSPPPRHPVGIPDVWNNPNSNNSPSERASTSGPRLAEGRA